MQAANELGGKALLCVSKDMTYPVYGLVFDRGKVIKWRVAGYSKVISYTRSYWLVGTKQVAWNAEPLDRETLKVGDDQCSISSKVGIFHKLDEIIAAAKKKNKI